MTIRQSLIRAASQAKAALGESCSLVEKFILSRQNDDGGFSGRSPDSDLYYTVFAIESLIAVGAELPVKSITGFLNSFDPSELDIIHLAGLIRCYADLNIQLNNKLLSDELVKFRSSDGGFDNKAQSSNGSIYSAFMALGAYQDMNLEIPDESCLVDFIESRKHRDGSYSNDSKIKVGSVPATSAAVTLKHYLRQTVSGETIDWLKAAFHSNGGFAAACLVTIPDLLSTAVGLHALSYTDYKLAGQQMEKCLDFVDTLWSGKDGFCGSLADRAVDCEYTFYGLLAIGHLSK